ncbi:MAG: peptidoglycan-binding domain-containing protein [Paracoccaceae bacterium]
MRFKAYSIGALLVLAPVCAMADDRALVIGNSRYAEAANITGADAAGLAARAFQTAGFSVVSASDLPSDQIRERLSQLVTEGSGEGRLVILLSGHFAHSGSQSWFVGTESHLPDVAAIGGVAIPVATVLDIAALQPGGAVVLLGTEARRLPLGVGLQPGLGPLEVPQGVTVISGDAARIADFAARTLPARGQSLPVMLAGAGDLRAEGFLSTILPFRPADPSDPSVIPATPDAETIFWQSAEAQATPEAYDAYLKRYPAGRYAESAKAEAARIRAEPGRQARLAEDALTLSRDDRRAVQRALSLLDFDPRGIDGLFGAGSRNAIAAWQKKNAAEPTTYLTRDQITLLLSQSDARAKALEAEAQARKAEQDRQDQLYWNQTGAAGDEAGLRAYVKRYPDGLFADVAKDRLAAIEAAAREQAAAKDRAAWDVAVQGNTMASYTGYLVAFPKGAFAEEAKARIDGLQADAAETDDRARWQGEEDGLALSPAARQLIEARLDQLGFAPGPADGVFDQETRRAIRRFQTARDLPATGYLDQRTMVSLLADGVLKLGE